MEKHDSNLDGLHQDWAERFGALSRLFSQLSSPGAVRELLDGLTSQDGAAFNCRFRNGAAGSDASQNEGSLPRQSSCLHMGRDRSGQGELKRCTAPGSAGGPQAAAMRLDDRTADGQPHTSPVIFGRKECIEDLFRLLRGKSHTGITDRDQQLSIAGFRPDGKLTSASHSLHGIDTVEHEVHEYLLQLDAVRHDVGKIAGKFVTNQNRMPAGLAVQ